MVKLVGGAKLTPLSISALALLCERDMHPYEMYQTMMARREDVIVKVRPGSLYHTVNRLVESGLVEAVGTEREGNRPERTTYRVTESGRFALRSAVGGLLATPAEEYPIFPVAVAELASVPPAEAVGHLRNRMVVLEREAAEMRRALAEHPHVPRIHMLDIEYLATMREAEIGWLRGVVEQIENRTLVWERCLPARAKRVDV